MIRQRLILATGLLLAVMIGVQTYVVLRNRHASPPVAKATPTPVPGVSVSTTTPDEVKPQKGSYPALPTGSEPENIAIPSVGIDHFIQRVSVDQTGAIAVPTNIHLAGWFTNSVTPGDKGLSIIDGHVDGRVADGIFKHLAEVKTGDKIVITEADGVVRNFSVMSVQTVATADAGNLLFSQDPSVVSQLNLITCGGTFDATQKQYDKRVIVSAKLVE